MTESIKIVNVTKNYGNIKAVENFNFTAQKGEVIALLGPNGAGKSTLMNMITGFLAPSSGQIYVEGLNIADYPEKSKEKIDEHKSSNKTLFVFVGRLDDSSKKVKRAIRESLLYLVKTIVKPKICHRPVI